MPPKKYKTPKAKPAYDESPDLHSGRKRKSGGQRDELWDDAPSSYKNIMKWQADRKRDAEDGKKRLAKKGEAVKIRKGESMHEFHRRVNDSMPLPRAKGGPDSAQEARISKRQRHKAENLRKVYQDRWDRKREEDDEAGEDEEKYNWSNRDRSPDPWAKLEAKNKKPKFGEVADRPPELPPIKRLSNVPKNSGSQARREILAEERQAVIDSYRRLKTGRANDS